MRKLLWSLVVFLLSVASAVCPARANDATAADAARAKKTEMDKSDAGEKEAKLSVTEHKLTIDGRQISYTATAGTLPLKTDEGKTTAAVFFVAYTRDDVKDDQPRPLTFCFNGGPGSSAVWLHMGMLGPQRVEMPEGGAYPAPPYTMIPNTYSLLDVTDLVFIDPVSTGYSRPAEGEKKDQFHGFSEDIQSVGQFIHLYTTKYGRWGSPRFLIGESYGTLRAAGLSEHLQSRYHMSLNGIVLVSTVIDFQTLSFSASNDLPFILFLPSYTATAWYHQRLESELQNDLERAVEEARQFAFGPYAAALLKGDSLAPAELRELSKQMARLTGLSPKYVQRAKLRVSMSRFSAELLERRDLIVGRFDSRYTGPSGDPIDDTMDYDPSAGAVFPAYTESFYQYVRESLGIERDDVYEILTSKVHPWNYQNFQNRYVESAGNLRGAMLENPFMKVFVANGYYDLATPFAGAEYSFDHLDLPEHLRDNVTMGYYEGGHMMYVHEPSLAKLRGDLLKFYDDAQQRPAEPSRKSKKPSPKKNKERDDAN